MTGATMATKTGSMPNKKTNWGHEAWQDRKSVV